MILDGFNAKNVIKLPDAHSLHERDLQTTDRFGGMSPSVAANVSEFSRVWFFTNASRIGDDYEETFVMFCHKSFAPTAKGRQI